MPRFALLAVGVTGGVTGALGALPFCVLVLPDPLVPAVEPDVPVVLLEPVLVEPEVLEEPDPEAAAAAPAGPASDPPQPPNNPMTTTATAAARNLKVDMREP
jgi:hypothetical protein